MWTPSHFAVGLKPDRASPYPSGSICLTSLISDHSILRNPASQPEVPVHQSYSWTLCWWSVVSQTVNALSHLVTSLCLILPPWQTKSTMPSSTSAFIHMFHWMTIKRIKKEEKNIFSSPGTNSGFMLITFSHDYTGQKVSQAAHAAIFHLFVEDYDDLHVLFVEKQTGRQCRKNFSSTGSQPAPTAWRLSHIYWLKEKKEHMVSSKKHQKKSSPFCGTNLTFTWTWHEKSPQ